MEARFAVTRVESTHELAGAVFCPRCGFRLGRADSPAIGYLTRCGGCDRPLAIAREGATLRVSIADESAEH